MSGIGRRSFLRASATGGAAVAALWGLGACTSATGSDSADGSQTESLSEEYSAADVGYLADMSAHHGQALVMCQRVLGHEVGVPVAAGAAELLQNQSIEVGMMRAWLADWGLSTAPPKMVMGWMGMNDGDGMPLAMMPGLATATELQELSKAVGKARGRRWLELMMVHHQGGVAMAKAVATMGRSEKVVRLARNQAEVQTYEIAVYQGLLDTVYAS